MAVKLYVIRRTSDDAYVAAIGLPTSYTNRLSDARTYRTKSLAEDDCCGNETVMSYDECFHEGYA